MSLGRGYAGLAARDGRGGGTAKTHGGTSRQDFQAGFYGGAAGRRRQPWIWLLSEVTKVLITRSSATAMPRMTAVMMASSTADAPTSPPSRACTKRARWVLSTPDRYCRSAAV